MKYFICLRPISNSDIKANTRICIKDFVTTPRTQRAVFLPVTPWQCALPFSPSRCNGLYQTPRLWSLPYSSNLCHLLSEELGCTFSFSRSGLWPNSPFRNLWVPLPSFSQECQSASVEVWNFPENSSVSKPIH